MKYVAASIIVLAAAIVAQPYVSQKITDASTKEVADQCALAGASEWMSKIAKDQFFDSLEAANAAQGGAALERSKVMDVLSADLSDPYADSVDRDLKSASCGVSITLKIKDLEQSGIANFKVYRTSTGVSFTTSPTDLTPLITQLISKMK